MSRRLAVVVAAGLVLALAAALVWRASSSRTTVQAAVALAPADSARLSWTDWSGVRRELGADLDADSSVGDVETFLGEAFTRDLSSMSALGTSAGALQEHFGWSPATLEWELFAQSDRGAVVILRLAESTAWSSVSDRLESLGWRRPSSPGGVWAGGPDVLASVDTALTPELQHFVVLADEGLLLASDQVPHLEQAAEVATGESDGARDLADLAGGLGEALSATVQTGAHACERLAMAQADADAQAEGERLVDEAGGVHPLTAFAMGQSAGGDLRVAMEVQDEDDARHDADARAALASGPAPGQGGAFTDRFTVTSARAEGPVVLLDLEPEPGQYALSDLTSGPVLFATC